MNIYSLIIFYHFVNIYNALKFDDDGCIWNKHMKAPEIYFINMDKSVERKISMEKHLKNVGLKYRRVRGNPWNEIYIPPDLGKTWTTVWCKSQTDV